MLTAPEYLVVDLDGTLLDTAELNNQAYALALRECLGIDILPLLRSANVRFNAQVLDSLLVASCSESVPLEALKTQIIQSKKEHLFRLDPQLLVEVYSTTLAYLKRYVYIPCFLLTNASKERTYWLLDRLSFGACFNEVYCNPNPMLNKYSYTCEELPLLNPMRGLLLENEVAQMELAIEAGFPSDVIKLVV